ncbi:DUF2238 domain-containing protein [Laceyella putida]|uniref:DUF2238 domain-containing protein n=1 Tax=Laceyella putida TaxID=110101 RepID=A0ABW2RNC0_9BACL
MNDSHRHLIYLLIGLIVFIWSAIEPLERFTWFLEVAPSTIFIAVLIYMYPRFPLTHLTYLLILFWSIVIFIGGHYTYAEMPLFNTIRDQFQLDRNYYDRFAHVIQGLAPAIFAREIFIRRQIVLHRRWLAFLVVCVCLAFSAAYELLEFFSALVGGAQVDAFLGTQGDVWDPQWDMTCALIGAVLSLALFSRMHDRQMNKGNNESL